MVLKWQLSGLQSETNCKVRPEIFGIRYYFIRNTGQQLVTFSGSNIVTLKKSKSNIQHRGLVVFFYEATETPDGDFIQLCIEQVVAKKKIPFILCLRNSEKALDQMITVKEKLQDCLKKTHWIIQKEIMPCKFIFSIINNLRNIYLLL